MIVKGFAQPVNRLRLHNLPPAVWTWNGPLTTLLALALALVTGVLLVRLTPLDGVLFVGLAVAGVATVIDPWAGLVVALFLGPLRAYLQAEVPQVPAQIAQGFVALALAAWLARGFARRNVRILRSPLLLPLSIFLGAALLSQWNAVELPAYGIPELIKWVQILLLALFVGERLVADTGGSPLTPALSPGGRGGRETGLRSLYWLLGALLATGFLQACVGIWQFGLRGEGPAHFAILGGRFFRAYGTFEQPNPYAGYLGLTLPLALGVTWGIVTDAGTRGHGDKETGRQGDRETRRWRHLVTWLPCLLAILLVIVAMGAALIMSWSRGAWLGFGAAASVMAVALPRQARWGLLLAAVLVVAVVGLHTAGLLPASVTARLTDFARDVRFEDVRGVGINDANYAVVERLAHWQAALGMFRHRFWTGVGFGGYEPAYRDFALVNWPIALGHAHNYYLNLAAEAGLIGLLAYLLLWGTVFWQTWRATRRTSGFLRGVAIGLLGAWTHLTVHHLLDNLYVNNVHLHVGALLGLLAFIVQIGKSASLQISKSTD
ncbi:MAG TPA: O-antigen ligase family protein [Anaerolineae bacterium]|nr:O-antigen ligase family protein [Anaerolineae bacterium]